MATGAELMPNRSDNTDSYSTTGDYLLGGGISWGILLIILFLVYLYEESL